MAGSSQMDDREAYVVAQTILDAVDRARQTMRKETSRTGHECSPSAIRIPISCVRCATEYAVTAYRPAPANSNPTSSSRIAAVTPEPAALRTISRAKNPLSPRKG